MENNIINFKVVIFLLSLLIFSGCGDQHLVEDTSPHPIARNIYYCLEKKFAEAGMTGQEIDNAHYNKEESLEQYDVVSTKCIIHVINAYQNSPVDIKDTLGKLGFECKDANSESQCVLKRRWRMYAIGLISVNHKEYSESNTTVTIILLRDIMQHIALERLNTKNSGKEVYLSSKIELLLK